MTNIKISELNELETRHRNDLLAIVNSSNNETEKIKVENLINENVELIAVSSTAPSECSLGDKYFNTTSNKIYTAIATDTWSSTGENAVEGILYVVFGDQSTYAYNGTTLISVGGGSGSSDIIIIGDESEATEDTKLVVDTTGTTDTLKYKDNNSFTELQIKALDSLEIGTILSFAGTIAPTSYMICDGSAISRTTYSALFNLIGTSFGSGDGSTTFNIPDLRGRNIIGLDTRDTDFDTIGKTGGYKIHIHTLPLGADANSIYASINEQKYPVTVGIGGGKYAGFDGVTGETIDAIASYPSSSLSPYGVANFIIKVAETTPRTSETINTFSNSTKDSYACDYVNSLITTQTETINVGTFTALGEKFNQTYTITLPTGYTSFGILGYSMSGGGFTNLCLNGLRIEGNTIHYSIKNTQNYETSVITFTIYVGLIKGSNS